MNEADIFLADEMATEASGAALARAVQALPAEPSTGQSWQVWLKGPLGAGKTSFCRGLLRALGHQGTVKSPTYTLVEPYDMPLGAVFHFDLYRLRDPAELEDIGARDYFSEGRLCLVEWPELGEGYLPAADLVLSLSPSSHGRHLHAEACSARAALLMKAFSPSPE